MGMNVFVIIPAYNEEMTIGRVVREVLKKVDRVVVVDDASEDKTARIARQEGAVVIKHFLNRGQGASLQTGISYALKNGADILVTFDADGQHDPSDIPPLIHSLIQSGVDVVLGSRFLRNIKGIPLTRRIPLTRLLLLKAAVVFTKITTGLRVTDTHNGLRAFRREAAERIMIHQDRMAHASEILEQIAEKKLRYREVPVTIRYTRYSLQKGQHTLSSLKILWDLFLGKMSK